MASEYSNFTRKQLDILKGTKLSVPCSTWNSKDARQYFGKDFKAKNTPAHVKKVTHFQKNPRFEVYFQEIDAEFYVDLGYILKYAKSLPLVFRKKKKTPAKNVDSKQKTSSTKSSKGTPKSNKHSNSDRQGDSSFSKKKPEKKETELSARKRSKETPKTNKRSNSEPQGQTTSARKRKKLVKKETELSSAGTCEHPMCKSEATFNFEGEGSGIYCTQHRIDAMVDVISFLPEVMNIKVDIKSESLCQVDGCVKTALFNFGKETVAKFCPEHKLKNMVRLEKKRICQFPSCGQPAVFTYQGNQSFYCSSHQQQSKRTFKEAISPAKRSH